MSDVFEKASILLAEEDEDTIFLVRRALVQFRLLNPLHVIPDGCELVDYLRAKEKLAGRNGHSVPELLILSLQLPGLDGFEFLRWLRQDSQLKNLRVLVLLSFETENEVKRAYQLGANAFLRKPIKAESFLDSLTAVNGYWLWTSGRREIVAE